MTLRAAIAVASCLAVVATTACGGDSLSGNPRLLDGGAGGQASGTGGAASTGGTSAVGDASTKARIGGKCSATSECGTGLFCALASGGDLVGGGPPHGLCTADCSIDFVQSTDTCGALDPNTACIAFNLTGSVAFCLELCTLGAVAPGSTKCQSRTDMACSDSGFTNGTGTCTPTCRGDFDCPLPRVCDLSSGLCVDPGSIVGAALLGASCDPTAVQDPCRAGFCISTGGGAGICTGFCTLGTAGCGEEPTASSLDAYCILSTEPTFFDVGDQGYCGQLCDCDNDCRGSGYVCVPNDPSVALSSNRFGYCTEAGPGIGGTPCTASDGGPG